MTSDPLDLEAAICRFVLDDLSGEELVAVAEHSLEQGRWCDVFCVLVGWKEPILREVGPYFEKGVRTLGLGFPGSRDAVIGVGVWRSKQVIDGIISPAEATFSLRKIGQMHGEYLDPILAFYQLDYRFEVIEALELEGIVPFKGYREAEREVNRLIVEEARRFLAEHAHRFPGP